MGEPAAANGACAAFATGDARGCAGTGATIGTGAVGVVCVCAGAGEGAGR